MYQNRKCDLNVYMYSLSLTSKVMEFCILQLVMTGKDWDACKPLSEYAYASFSKLVPAALCVCKGEQVRLRES
jgi:hypothetical protein